MPCGKKHKKKGNGKTTKKHAKKYKKGLKAYKEKLSPEELKEVKGGLRYSGWW